MKNQSKKTITKQAGLTLLSAILVLITIKAAKADLSPNSADNEYLNAKIPYTYEIDTGLRAEIPGKALVVVRDHKYGNTCYAIVDTKYSDGPGQDQVRRQILEGAQFHLSCVSGSVLSNQQSN